MALQISSRTFKKTNQTSSKMSVTIESNELFAQKLSKMTYDAIRAHTDIQHAWRNGNMEPLVKFLKNNRPDSAFNDIGRTLLFSAVWDYTFFDHEKYPKDLFVKIVDLLLTKGADVNNVDNIDNNILSALHFQMLDNTRMKTNCDLLRKLLKHGAEVTQGFIECNANYLEVVKILVEFGNDVTESIDYVSNKEVLTYIGCYEASEETNKLIEFLGTTGRKYNFGSKRFYEDDDKNTDLAKQTKVLKSVTANGYHGGRVIFFDCDSVSAMDILKQCHKFVRAGDMYRNINRVTFEKETKDAVWLKIEVDNFST
jgi:hypothetical protein